MTCSISTTLELEYYKYHEELDVQMQEAKQGVPPAASGGSQLLAADLSDASQVMKLEQVVSKMRQSDEVRKGIVYAASTSGDLSDLDALEESLERRDVSTVFARIAFFFLHAKEISGSKAYSSCPFGRF